MSSCVYAIPRLLSLLVLACMLIYDRCMIVDDLVELLID